MYSKLEGYLQKIQQMDSQLVAQKTALDAKDASLQLASERGEDASLKTRECEAALVDLEMRREELATNN